MERQARWGNQAWRLGQESTGGNDSIPTELYPSYERRLAEKAPPPVKPKHHSTSSSSTSWNTSSWWQQSWSSAPWQKDNQWKRKWEVLLQQQRARGDPLAQEMQGAIPAISHVVKGRPLPVVGSQFPSCDFFCRRSQIVIAKR